MNISYIYIENRDYNHTLWLYEEKKWNVPSIEKVKEVYVDTIEDILNKLCSKYTFGNEIQFNAYEPNHNILLLFITFFCARGYKLKKIENDYGLYLLKKENLK